MTKIEQIEMYIEKCLNCTSQHCKGLSHEITSIFACEIDNINIGLDKISCRHIAKGTIVDYAGDVNLLKSKLENYKINLQENERKEENELEKLRLQAEISKNQLIINNTNQSASTATVTVSVTIDQAVDRIQKLPKEILSDEERTELENKLNAVEVARNSNDKKRLWIKLEVF